MGNFDENEVSLPKTHWELPRTPQIDIRAQTMRHYEERIKRSQLSDELGK